MKYSTHTYAKALTEAVLEPKAVGANIEKNFLALVRKNGDEARARKIIEEAGRLARGKSGIRKVKVESARTLAVSQEKLIKELIKPGDIFEKSINPELIAGIRVIVNDELQFDGSLKGKLDTIFGNIEK